MTANELIEKKGRKATGEKAPVVVKTIGLEDTLQDDSGLTYRRPCNRPDRVAHSLEKGRVEGSQAVRVVGQDHPRSQQEPEYRGRCREEANAAVVTHRDQNTHDRHQ